MITSFVTFDIFLIKLLISFSNKAPLFIMSGHEDKVLAVDWSVSQSMLSGAADNTIKIFRNADYQTDESQSKESNL